LGALMGGPAGGGRGGGRGAQQLLNDAARLQQNANQPAQQEPVAYAPVFYPGTPSPGAAVPITLTSGEERAGVDFQLQLVQTTSVSGVVASPDGGLPQGTQVTMVEQTGGPAIPGLGSNMVRVDQGGHFSFT